MPKSSKSMRKAVDEDMLLMKSVQRYFKLAGIASVVWLMGYFKFSVSWLWLLLVVYIWKEKHMKNRLKKITISQDIARNEKEVILARVDDLPSWVNFPDVERAEWVNKILAQMWPYIVEILEKILRENVEKSIRQSLPMGLHSFKFSKIELGNIPPRVGGVKVYTKLKRDEIYMDLELNYSSDSNIEVTIKGMSAGIKNMRIHGTLRVIFKPLINRLPLIGGMLIFFLNNPELDFDFTSLANALDLPGLSDILHSSIQEQISNFMVLPNCYPIKVVDGLDLNKIRYPQPQGVVRIKVIEAKDLIRADIGFTGRGKSDPYCKIRVGAKQVKTKVIQNSLSPVWDETFDLIVDSADGQLLYIDVFDEDAGTVHDELGCISLDLSQLKESGFEDEWFPLENVKHGIIHVQLTWLWLANQANELDRVVSEVGSSEMFHVALLLVYLDSASNIPRGKKTLNEPSPQVTLCVGQQVELSMIKQNTCEPKWEQNFRFMLHNPNYQNLDIEIVDTKNKKSIGSTVIKLKQVLYTPDMVMDQKFRVKGADFDCFVQMRLCLRILTPTFHPNYIDELEALVLDSPKSTRGDGKPGDSASRTTTQPETSSVYYGTSVDKDMSTVMHDKFQQTEMKKTNGTSSFDGGDTGTSVEEDVSVSPMTCDQESAPRQRKLRKLDSTTTAGRCGLGRIQMTFRYSHDREKLIIVIHRCANLRPISGDNKSLADPYVKLYLLPDKSNASKRRTKVCKNSVNPVFDETHEYSVSQCDIPKRNLWVSVKNEIGIFSTSKTDMGQALLDLSTLDVTKAVTEWFDLSPGNSLKLSAFDSDA